MQPLLRARQQWRRISHPLLREQAVRLPPERSLQERVPPSWRVPVPLGCSLPGGSLKPAGAANAISLPLLARAPPPCPLVEQPPPISGESIAVTPPSDQPSLLQGDVNLGPNRSAYRQETLRSLTRTQGAN